MTFVFIYLLLKSKKITWKYDMNNNLSTLNKYGYPCIVFFITDDDHENKNQSLGSELTHNKYTMNLWKGVEYSLKWLFLFAYSVGIPTRVQLKINSSVSWTSLAYIAKPYIAGPSWINRLIVQKPTKYVLHF